MDALHIKVPQVLIPKPAAREKWGIIAVDQYTSNSKYWDDLRRVVGTSPSTLNLILPEYYLDKPEEKTLTQGIHKVMHDYLAQGIFEVHENFVYVERSTPMHPCRRGLMVALDLECYDYSPTSTSPIRPTEGTVVKRIPPRLRIREGAPLESPHIMVLIDDPSRSVIEPLTAMKAQMQQLYGQDLLQNSGRVSGWAVPPSDHARLIQALQALTDPAAFARKYNVSDEVARNALLLYAIGDGNHSFATAKTLWENLKKQTAPADLPAIMANHPARYCMVELNNIYDEGIEFEPIHRVLFNCTRPLLETIFQTFPFVDVRRVADPAALQAAVSFEAVHTPDRHTFGLISAAGCLLVAVPRGTHQLAVGTLQAMLDQYFKDGTGCREIDYIHGLEETAHLGSQAGNVGILLPVMSKHELFPTVIKNKVLPRKTFSMGEADEKRFYFECRRILPQ